MLNNRREMYAQHNKYLYLALLIFASLYVSEAYTNVRNLRRRPVATSAKQAIEEVTAKASNAADQVALATSRADTNQYQRSTAYSTDTDRDYSLGNLELNLVRPENEPVHTKITAHYSSSLSTLSQHEPISLDEAETAEQYVANAMKMYGTRLHEPIRIPEQTQTSTPLASSTKETQNYAYIQKSQQPEQQQAHQQSYYFQEERREPQTQADLQKQYEEQQQHKQQQYHQQQQKHVDEQESQINVKALLEAQLKADLDHHLQEANKYAQEVQESQSERTQIADETQQDKYGDFDTVTRSYKVYEDNAPKHSNGQQVDRAYRSKYAQQSQLYRGGNNNENSNEDKVRISSTGTTSSTEIPKAEIMKQIEKSVLKYMKELEAEGKIITAPQEQKTYYRVIAQPQADEKYISSTTTRPKYSSSTPAYQSVQQHSTTTLPYGNAGGYNSGNSGNYNSGNGGNYNSGNGGNYNSGNAGSYSSASSHQLTKKAQGKQHYQTETETNYKPPSLAQQQQQDVGDALAPNVEFIYKIKTRAPLQTATVKTVSKPYSLPSKPSFEQFDHTSALKHIEEFDLSHVVSPHEGLNEERRLSELGPSTSKPNKLYFNSEIYHDINSLPYKPQKQVPTPAEYSSKVKSSDLPAEYKGYTGYFAEPGPLMQSEKDESASASSDDDSYLVQSPYQYAFKKEQKYEDDAGSAPINWEQIRNQNKPSYSAIAALKALETDSYNPKFNNNPEGYGYQHTYKGNPGRHAPGKRGKRGNGAHLHAKSNKKPLRHGVGNHKDAEAAIALRPPPKKLI